jgi:acyl-coenzyme A thioesterase PaaI-like protein
MVSSSPESGNRAVLEAARTLRAAVHDLADRSITVEPDPDALSAAAQLVDEAAAILDGDPSAPWWQGPTDDLDGIRTYRRRSLLQGELHPFSPAVRWEEGQGPAGQPGRAFRVTLSRLYQGPPGAVHGGFVSAMFDELLGSLQSLAREGGGYTAKLEVRYRNLTPLDRELRFLGWLVADKGRRVQVEATCMAGDTLCADAHGLFVRPAVSGAGT